MANKDILSSPLLIAKNPIQKSVALLEALRKAAQEAFDQEKPKDFGESVKETSRTVQRSVGSMRRALAGFDELNRMNRLKTATAAVKSQEQLLLEYLNGVDFQQTMAKFQLSTSYVQRCGEAMEALIEQMYRTDLALKLQENTLQRHSAAWQTLGTYLNIMGMVLHRLTQDTTQWSLQANQMAVNSATLKTALQALQARLEQVNLHTANAQLQSGSLAVKWNALQESGAQLSSLLSVLRSRFMGLFDENVQQSLTGHSNQLKQSLFQLQQYVQSGFFPGWKRAWEQIGAVVGDEMGATPQGIKLALNATISLFNTFLSKLTAGFNSWITSANQLQLKLGAITGTQVQRLPAMTTPKIPLLARGAVLPANQPFLAVVGDQRHGTNVEAPLATIQEAVANVMEDSIGANMAGHEATVGVLREILGAVLGISIGDDVIGAAAQRYRSKMAVVTGGSL